jgi:hypothetical protein
MGETKARSMKKAPRLTEAPSRLLFFPFPKVERLIRAQNSTGQPLIARALPSYSHERIT